MRGDPVVWSGAPQCWCRPERQRRSRRVPQRPAETRSSVRPSHVSSVDFYQRLPGLLPAGAFHRLSGWINRATSSPTPSCFIHPRQRRHFRILTPGCSVCPAGELRSPGAPTPTLPCLRPSRGNDTDIYTNMKHYRR